MALALVILFALVMRITKKGNRASIQTSSPVFTASVTSNSPLDRREISSRSAANSSAPEEKAGISIQRLAELDAMAREMNAVFIYLPVRGRPAGAPAFAAINAAKRSLEARFEIKMGLFTLAPDSSDYAEIAARTPVPGVLVIVKSGSQRSISGELTEDSIVDGFMLAVATGGCCPLGGPPERR